MRKTNIFRRDAVRTAKRGFKGKAAALLASAAMGLAACGDTIHNHYYETDGGAPTVNVEAPEVNVDVPDVTVNMPSDSAEVSALCTEDAEAAFETTINSGEALLLRNGLRLELRDMEDSTQTAFFRLTDEDGVTLEHVDMVEGVEGTINLGDGDVAIVACAVRVGYQFNERSVTLRADSDISREAPACEDDTWVGMGRTLENGISQDVSQNIQFNTCEEGAPSTVLAEITDLEPGLEAGEGREGLAVSQRLTVSVCSETYTILDIRPDAIELGKEAVSFLLGESADAVLAPNVTLVLEGVEEHGGVKHLVISVVDESGEVASRFHFGAQETITLAIDGELYSFHAYQILPPDSEGRRSALMAVLSDIATLSEGSTAELPCGDYVDGSYSFSMRWDGESLTRWVLTRE